jgi:CRP/FNR family transcriptional regulator, cyclic AMP receptor protein
MQSGHRTTSHASQVLLEDPELAQNLTAERRATAARDCVARSIQLQAGPWTPAVDVENMRFGIGMLILDGLVTRRVGIAGRFGAELLGKGDVLRPWQSDEPESTIGKTTKWRILRPSRMAILDSDFAVRISRYPEVVSTLFARTVSRARCNAVNLAVVQQPRIDLRLQMLFWQLADQWGTVRPDGVHVPLHLTHSILADLVAARRPTVTKALGELSERSAVIWTGTDWWLPGDPPDEIDGLAPVSISTGQ